MSIPLRVLIIEDSEEAVLFLINELKRGGYDPVYDFVYTEESMNNALDIQTWDLIIAYDSTTNLNILTALSIFKSKAIDSPFIIISNNVDEETAVNIIKAGSHDYIAKKDISRLVPTIKRELRRAEERRERRYAEEELRKSEEKYRVLAETAREIIIIIDLEGKITYINRTGIVLSSHKEDHLLQMNIADIILAKRIAGIKECYLYEAEFINKFGDPIPVEVTSSLLIEQNKPSGMLIIARDITEKKRSENEAKLQQEQLFQADKMASLGTLVAGVAHEINNPISSVMLNAPILQLIWDNVIPILDEHCKTNGDFYIGSMTYSQLRERVPMLLSDIIGGAKRIKSIVNDLKDFSRQTPSLLADMVDLNVAVEKALRLVANLIKKSTRHFSVNYYPSIPLFKGNIQRIEQIIVNLLVNACQAISNADKSIKVFTDYDKNDNSVVLIIQDEGIGMAQEVIQRIKDPFFTTKREFGGTGLGLSISDKIVKDHSGSMTFDSFPGQGTTVKVIIPIGSKGKEEKAEVKI